MASLTTSSLSKQNSILSTIDAFIAALEKFPDNECQEVEVDTNPFAFLLELAKHCGVTEAEIIEWLVSFLKTKLPIVELGVKGILLANLKQMIDCSVNPLIPAYARSESSGMVFDISSIDCMGMLGVSPLDEYSGSQMYFGVPKGDTMKDGTVIHKPSPYNFLRPLDFNTFLWYVIHRGRYPMPTIINGDVSYDSTFNEKFLGNVTTKTTTEKANNILDITELTYSSTAKTASIILGNSFRESVNGVKLKNISVCSECEYSTTDTTPRKILYNKLLPVGNNWKATNYYVNRPTYFNFLDPTGNLDITNPRKNNSDFALCSFEYLDERSDGAKELNTVNYLNNRLKIVIKPKPLVHLPMLGQTTLIPTVARFDNHGKKNYLGRFSVKSESTATCSIPSDLEQYKVLKYSNEISTKYDVLKVFKDARWSYSLQSVGEGGSPTPLWLVLNSKGDYWISDSQYGDELDMTNYDNQKKVLPYLYECYPNLTIYEFNYDYIMSMRLFDSKVVVTQLINQLMNFHLGVSLDISSNQIEQQDRIINIVKKIVDSNDYSSSDCFFNFSNSQYEQMSRDAELKRAKLIPFGTDCYSDTTRNFNNIVELLNKFGDAATLTESIDTFTNVINEVSATINPSNEEGESDNSFKLNTKILIDQLILNLVSVLVNALLSPKVVLMILINKKLCERDSIENIMTMDIERLLREMVGMITQIVKEIRDLLLQSLFEFVIKIIKGLLVLLASKLLLEQAEAYRHLIKQLLENCWFKFGRSSDLPTVLDKVNYADIDTPQGQPESDKC